MCKREGPGPVQEGVKSVSRDTGTGSCLREGDGGVGFPRVLTTGRYVDIDKQE